MTQTTTRRTWTRRIAALIAVAVAAIALAACGSSGSSGASAAKSGLASATANPQVQHEIDQAKDLVATCFAGTPLQQIHQVRLVFLTRSHGKHADDVAAARDKTFTCLGVPKDQRTNFKNDAITAAEHQTPKILSRHPVAGVEKYLTITLPQLVLKYKHLGTGPYSPPAGTSGGVPGASVMPGSASPAPSTTGAGA